MKNKVDNIIRELKWRINSRIYKKSEKLPSENQVAIKMHCSRLTARKALQQLITEKLIISRKGKGYFVSLGNDKRVYRLFNNKKIGKNQFHIANVELDENALKIFKNLHLNVARYKEVFAFSFIKTQFDLQEIPFTVLHSFVNTKFTGEIKISEIRNSFSKFLVKRNIKIVKRIEKIEVIRPEQWVRLKLNLKKNQFVVAAYSIMFDHNNKAIEFAIRYTKVEHYSDVFEKKY